MFTRLRNEWYLWREDLMASVQDFERALAAIDTVTNEIAAEVARLRAQLALGGLTEVQEAAVLAALADVETRLRAVASEPVVEG